MKTIFITALLIFTSHTAKPQIPEDVTKDLYYERTEIAKSKLVKLLSDERAAPDAIYWLGEIYLQQGKFDSAQALYKEKATTYLQKKFSKKESPLVYIGWAHLLLDSGKVQDATIQIENILSETKYKNPIALWAAAKAHTDSKNGDPAAAILLLDKAIKKDKENPLLYNLLGDAYRKSGDGSNAVRNYDKAFEVDKSNAAAIYKIGKIYKTQNNPDIYLEKFKMAYNTDSTYSPVLYELYQYYFSRDVFYAQRYLEKYIANSDPDPQHAYMKADLQYVSKKYQEAINTATQIFQHDSAAAQPRLYKLMAYSYAALGDSVAALKNMTTYFDKQDSSDYVARDFALQAKLMETQSTDTATIIDLYSKAILLETDNENKTEFLSSVADIAHSAGKPGEEANWRGMLYQTKKSPSNLDLYNWGLALFQANEFEKADSVFAMYEEKYPEQVYGYLYRARSNSFLDSAMEKGLAVPHYKKLIEVAGKDEARNKRLLLMAYEYLGAYEANVTRQYPASLEYYDKILELDPENDDAAKNSQVIKKWIDNDKADN